MKEARHRRSHTIRFHFYETPRRGKSTATEGRLAGARVGWGGQVGRADGQTLLKRQGVSSQVTEVFQN